MQVRKILPWAILTALLVACVLLFDYWAPGQYASISAYTGLVLLLAGTLCAAFPFRCLGVRRRVTGVCIALAGLLMTTLALLWPATLVRVERHSTKLDELRPDYHFCERHTVRVHAPVTEVMAAIEQTTSGELPAASRLMRVRGAIMRQKVEWESDAIRRKRILDELTAPGSGFVLLQRDDREIVLGMAGQPWAGQRSPKITEASQYATFRQPGSVKIAVNLRVEDAGGGWSLLTTDTRVLGIDDNARRTMARYWRFIVPGSGLIRRQWLDAIRNRAEGRFTASGGSISTSNKTEQDAR